MAIAIGDDLRHNDVSSLATAVTRTSTPALGGDSESPLDAETSKIDRTTKWVWIGYTVLSVLIFAYLISLLVRTPAQQWTWLDGWTTVAIEVVASSMCIARGLYKHPGRSAPLALGFALLAWTIGDALLTYESLGGKTPPTPSWADLSYVCFYPLAYIAAVQMLRKAMGRLSRPNWLDGVGAGLGAAAVCAAFAFHDIVHAAGGSALSAATNLAYPVGDLLL